ncbi:MAG: flagellar protein FlgN, partial [Gammaproteobacteria bacterium]|nr:flagellar protein FlgN [Gammaproteobacteria bacterium]
REQFLSKCAVLGVAATETLIGNLSSDTGITRSWRQLKDIGAKLKRQNEINGMIITLGQRNTQNALGVLSGRQPSASATYNPDGARQRDFGSSTLAKV